MQNRTLPQVDHLHTHNQDPVLLFLLLLEHLNKAGQLEVPSVALAHHNPVSDLQIESVVLIRTYIPPLQIRMELKTLMTIRITGTLEATQVDQHIHRHSLRQQ